MINIKNYKFGFELWGLLLFLLIMIPNFIWFAVPAPDDVLRNDSVTPELDSVAQIFQIIMIASMCTLLNVKSARPMYIGYRISIITFIILYFTGWIMYYTGVVNTFIILDLCIAPCMAFLLYSIARRNVVSVLSTSAFMICHVAYGIINLYSC